MERKDDFELRRQHLKGLNEKQLEEKFWELCGRLMDPIIDLAASHTSPSIERSVLLRMGFSSLESKSIVQGAIDHGLLEHGAGHIVYKLSKERHMDLLDTGRQLTNDKLWDEAASFFKAGQK
ncbi:MAG: ornithine aminomutase [Spirochaetaceae bacterium 4572_59]|nr:MAG: ornithine aminomutase [Spirochaetaceae bacterium 4572_59]